MKKVTIGVMGPGSNATPKEIQLAELIGKLIAEQGWNILTGGVNTGVMHAALKGAKEAVPACTTIAILPHKGEPEKISEYADVCMPTGMGEGRNILNVKTSDAIIFCCDDLTNSLGTASELLFTIKHEKPFVIVISPGKVGTRKDRYRIFTNMFSKNHRKHWITQNPEEAIQQITEWL